MIRLDSTTITMLYTYTHKTWAKWSLKYNSKFTSKTVKHGWYC